LKPLGGTSLPAEDRAALVAFEAKAADLQRIFSATSNLIRETEKRLKHIRKAVYSIPTPTAVLTGDLTKIENTIKDIRKALWGDPVAGPLDKPTSYSVASRIGSIGFGMWNSTSAPTQTQLTGYRIAREKLKPQVERLNHLIEVDLKSLEHKLEEAGAPYTPGREVEWGKN